MPQRITRFALLRHEMPAEGDRPSHWDLLLERDDSCWTWAIEVLPEGLSAKGGPTSVSVMRLPDHRKHYLDYEGPLTKDRGSVSRELGGECEWLESSEKCVRVRLSSEREPCELTIEQVDFDTWRAATF